MYKKVYQFNDGTLFVAGTEEDLSRLADNLMDINDSSRFVKLRQKIMYAFNIEGIRADAGEPDATDLTYADRHLMTNPAVSCICSDEVIYEFCNYLLTVWGTTQDMLDFAEVLRDAEGPVGDLRYKIEFAFNIDSVRSENDEVPDLDYAKSNNRKGGLFRTNFIDDYIATDKYKTDQAMLL